MTLTVVIKRTRPNTGVEWYSHADSSTGSPMSDSDRAHIKSAYIDTGKRISATTSLSANELEQTKTFVYRDKAAYDEYEADSKITSFISAQRSYNSSNNITLTSRTSSAT